MFGHMDHWYGIPFRENKRGGDSMRTYERPTLTAAGSFAKVTGLLRRHGNDGLIFEKN